MVCSKKGDWFDACHEYDSADETDNVYIESSCYPAGYRDIFLRKTGSFSDIVTAAFPGTACPSGWAVPSDGSCRPKIALGSVHYSQAWCCPPGFDSCVSNLSTRNCYRTIASPTQIWTRTIQTTTASDVSTVAAFATTLVNANSQKPLEVYHAVFPLAITSTTASAGFGVSEQPGLVPQDGGGNGNGSATVQVGLPPAIVAGIVIGVVAGLALIAAVLIFLFMRRRRATEVRHSIVPHRTGTSTPGLPEDGSGGVGYDPFAPGQATPGLYSGDPKMLSAMAAADPIVSRWHSPATVGAYAATARSASPYDAGDPNTQGVELVEQSGQMEAVGVDNNGTATPQPQPQLEDYYAPQKPNMPPGNVELAELESHPLDRMPVEIDSNPSAMPYEPTPVTGAPFSAVTTSVSPLRNPDSAAITISPPPDEDNRRHF